MVVKPESSLSHYLILVWTRDDDATGKVMYCFMCNSFSNCGNLKLHHTVMIFVLGCTSMLCFSPCHGCSICKGTQAQMRTQISHSCYWTLLYGNPLLPPCMLMVCVAKERKVALPDGMMMMNVLYAAVRID